MPVTHTDRLEPRLVRLVWVLGLGAIMALLDATIVNVGVHTLVGAFDSTLAAIQWVSTGYLLAVAVTAPVTGWAVDRFGGRRMWLFGLSLFLGGSLLSALAWDVPSLIATRVITGVGGGMLEPIMLTLLATAAGPARAGRVIGLGAIPMNLGPVLGPVIGGVVLHELSWQWMFLINLPVGIVALLLALRVVPRDTPRTSEVESLDVRGMALLCTGFAVSMYGLSQASVHGFAAASVLAALAVGAAFLLAYATYALRTNRAPLIDLRLFRNPGFSAGVAVISLVGATMFATLFLLPLYYQRLEGHGELAAGLLLAPFGVGAVVGMPLAGRVSDRTGARSLVTAGGVLVAGSFLPYALGATGPVLVVSLLATGLGLGSVGGPTMGSVYRTVPRGAASRATGVLYILNQLGGALGIAIVALVLQHNVTGARLATAFADTFWWLFGAAAIITAAAQLLPGPPAAASEGDSDKDAFTPPGAL